MLTGRNLVEWQTTGSVGEYNYSTDLTAIVDGVPADRASLPCKFGDHTIVWDEPGSDFSFISGTNGSPFRGYAAQLAVWRGEIDILREVRSFNNIPRRLAIAMATHHRLGEASPLAQLSNHVLQRIASQSDMEYDFPCTMELRRNGVSSSWELRKQLGRAN